LFPIEEDEREYVYQLPKDFYKCVAVQIKKNGVITNIQRESIVSQQGGYSIIPDQNVLRVHFYNG
jgi:hypothetical protein